MGIRLAAGRNGHPVIEFTKRVSPKTGAVNYWERKNTVLRKILEDFPYLWAIHSRWGSSVSSEVKISQDMQDLRLALSQPSTATRFALWALTIQPCELVNGRMERIVRTENATWAKAVLEQTQNRIEYVFLVGSPDSDYAAEEIIIFRSPDETNLGDVVKMAIQLQG